MQGNQEGGWYIPIPVISQFSPFRNICVIQLFSTLINDVLD